VFCHFLAAEVSKLWYWGFPQHWCWCFWSFWMLCYVFDIQRTVPHDIFFLLF